MSEWDHLKIAWTENFFIALDSVSRPFMVHETFTKYGRYTVTTLDGEIGTMIKKL